MCMGGYLWGRCCYDQHTPKIKQKPAAPVPLTGVVVSCNVIDFCAEVKIQQRYENVEDVPVEAFYVFPLDEKASVSDFYAIVDGKKVSGKIKEKEKAKDDYDDAIASGHSAYLLEEEKPNQFKTSVGNLPPKSEVVIVISYVTELQFTGAVLEFSLPTNTKAFPDGVVQPRFANPAINSNRTGIPYGLKVDIDFKMTSAIHGVTSSTHPIRFVHGDSASSGVATLAKEDVGTPLVQNLLIEIALAEPNKPVLRVQENVGMLALYPDLSVGDEDPITEMIFIVDRSGSMSGTKMQRTKDTMQIFLRSLPLGTLFNIVGFGTNFIPLFKEGSKEYDDNTLAKATDYVNTMGANLGGTALLPPLQSVLSTKPREGIPRQIFVLTDGEVDNTDACIQFVRKHSDTTRVFAFGIYGASPALVNGIAKAGEGKAELITGNENLETKVLAQLKRALQPALTDMRVDWGGLVREQTPFTLPPLFNGSRVIIYGYLAPDARPGKVVFSAHTAKGPYRFELDVDPAVTFPGNFIPKLAARSMIKDLEENRSAFQGINDAETKKKIIALSIQSGMLSKFTAFIAVHENDKAVEGTMQVRDVNQMQEKEGARVLSTSSSLLGGASYSNSGRSMPKGMMKSNSAAPRASRMAAPASRSAGFGGGGARYDAAPAIETSLSPMTAAYGGGSSDDEEDEDEEADYAPVKARSRQSEKKEEKKETEKEKDKSSRKKKGAVAGKSAVADADSFSFEEAEQVPKREERRASREAAPIPAASAAAPSALFSLAAPSLSRSSSSSPSSSSLPSSTPSGTGSVKDIVMKQSAAGSFKEDVLKLVGGDLATLKAKMPANLSAIPAPLIDLILITAFVCGILRSTYAGDKGQWELVEKKAISWLKKETKKAGIAEDLDWDIIATSLVI